MSRAGRVTIAGLALFVLGALSFALLSARDAYATGLAGPGLKSSGTPITGATISPATISLSGSAPQVTCSGTGVCELDSAAADATTSSTVPAIRLKATTNITDADLLLSAEDSASTRALTLTEAGVLGVASYYTTTTAGQFRVESLAADATTSSSVAGIRLGIANDITNTDVLVGVTNSTPANVFTINEQGGYRSVPQSLPTCDATLGEGTIVTVAGTANATPTKMCLCVQGTSGTYEWVNLMAPTDRTGNTTTCPASNTI